MGTGQLEAPCDGFRGHFWLFLVAPKLEVGINVRAVHCDSSPDPLEPIVTEVIVCILSHCGGSSLSPSKLASWDGFRRLQVSFYIWSGHCPFTYSVSLFLIFLNFTVLRMKRTYP